MMKISAKFKEKISVGLDIGTQNIKVVKFKSAQDAVELLSFAIEPIQTDLAETLKKLKQSQDLGAVNIAFSGPATVIRNIYFPKMNGAELKQALKFEAQKHVPFPLAEVNMDGCILKDDLPDNKMLVLLAAVKKEFIRQRLRSLELAGIRANVAEIDSLALVNAFNFNYPLSETPGLKAVALLNIGATHTNVDIIEEGITRLSRDIQIAGNNFSQKVADTLGIDLKTAEGIKISPSGDQYGRMMTGLEAVFTALSAEIRNSFDYFESQSASSVAKIFISGGGSLFMGFRDKLRSMLNLDVDYWDPFKKIKIGSQIEAEKLKALSSQLVVAAGMALRL